MFAPERILIAVDFSPSAAAALRTGLDLAARSGAQPHVLHVLPEFAALDPEVEALYSARERSHRKLARQEAEAELFGFLGRQNGGGEGLVRAVRFGHPATAVLDYASQHRVGAVVVGMHGRRGLRRLLLGSVASEVLHRSTVPVLAVPEPRTGGRDGQNGERGAALSQEPPGVLAPTDFSEASRLALPIASALADLYGAPLDLVHALEPIPHLTPTVELEVLGDLFGELRNHAAAELAREAARLSPPSEGADGVGDSTEGAAVRTHLKSGRAADVVLEAARELGSGFIVAAKHSRGALARLTLGSVTERVCRDAPCPVLVLPHGGPDERPHPAHEAALAHDHE